MIGRFTSITAAIAILLSFIIIDDINASVFTRKNAITMSALQEAFGKNVVGSKYDGTIAKKLYDNFCNAKNTFESIMKSEDLTKQKRVKIFIELLNKLQKALEDIYQSEEGSKLMTKANNVNIHYAANSLAYSNLKKIFSQEFLQSFETLFSALVVPSLKTANPSSNIVILTKNMFDIILKLQQEMIRIPVSSAVINTSNTNMSGYYNSNNVVQMPTISTTEVKQSTKTNTSTTSTSTNATTSSGILNKLTTILPFGSSATTSY